MKLNLITTTLGAIIGAGIVWAVLVGRDIFITELRHGSGRQ